MTHPLASVSPAARSRAVYAREFNRTLAEIASFASRRITRRDDILPKAFCIAIDQQNKRRQTRTLSEMKQTSEFAKGDFVHLYKAGHYNQKGIVENVRPSDAMGRIDVRTKRGELVRCHPPDLERIPVIRWSF